MDTRSMKNTKWSPFPKRACPICLTRYITSATLLIFLLFLFHKIVVYVVITSSISNIKIQKKQRDFKQKSCYFLIADVLNCVVLQPSGLTCFACSYALGALILSVPLCFACPRTLRALHGLHILYALKALVHYISSWRTSFTCLLYP